MRKGVPLSSEGRDADVRTKGQKVLLLAYGGLPFGRRRFLLFSMFAGSVLPTATGEGLFVDGNGN